MLCLHFAKFNFNPMTMFRFNSFKPVIVICLLLSSFFIIDLFFSCKKASALTAPDDSTPSLSISPILKKMEEDLIQGNGYSHRRYRDFSYYYDANRRLTEIGIKRYGLDAASTDTNTCFIKYKNDNTKPYMIIAPCLSGCGDKSDTTYYYYDNVNRLAKDSGGISYSNQRGQPIKSPIVRTYSYPDKQTILVHWEGPVYPEGPIGVLRNDTLVKNDNGQINILKSQYYHTGYYSILKDVLFDFNYSDVNNPLAELNISGTSFNLVYSRNLEDNVGMTTHPIAMASNVVPYYIDYFSPKIPTGFFFNSYQHDDLVLNQLYRYKIQVKTSEKYPNYPSQITVGIPTANLGLDTNIYRYYY